MKPVLHELPPAGSTRMSRRVLPLPALIVYPDAPTTRYSTSCETAEISETADPSALLAPAMQEEPSVPVLAGGVTVMLVVQLPQDGGSARSDTATPARRPRRSAAGAALRRPAPRRSCGPTCRGRGGGSARP